MSNVPATTTPSVPDSLEAKLMARKPQLSELLPSGLPVEKLIRSVIMSVSKTPALAQCSVASLLLCTIQAAEWGMEPDTALQHCHLIPMRIKGRMTAQLWPGYRGFVFAAMKAGFMKSCHAQVVYEKDEFEFSYGSEPYVKHTPTLADDRGAFKAVYAVVELVTGGKIIEVMSPKDLRRFDKDKDVWRSDKDQMRKKTALKQALKKVPMSGEDYRLGRLIEADNVLESGGIVGREDALLAKGMFDADMAAELAALAPETTNPETAGNASLKDDLKSKQPHQPQGGEIGDPEPSERSESPSEPVVQIDFDGSDERYQARRNELADQTKGQLHVRLEELLKDTDIAQYQKTTAMLLQAKAISTNVTGNMTKSDLLAVVAWIGSR